MDPSIKNKVIVVTGAAQGLGREIALHLAAKGAKLALIDLNPTLLTEAAIACAEAGASGVSTFMCNVSNEDSVESQFELIAHELGPIYGLVNNAGITRDGLLLKVDRETGKVVKTMSMDQWQSVIDVNLTGTFLCGREAAKHMVEAGEGGVIINISSICRAGNVGQTNYSASKAGVEAMAVTWAKELVKYGIRVNSIAPGYIGTEMVRSIKPEVLAKVEAMIPAKRLGEPSEIASTVAFLFENQYVSGRCFEVDGGLRI
jgi:3-oxoacyl-[acyl-carrier protein] reductase